VSTVRKPSVAASLPHNIHTATRRIAEHVAAEYRNQVPEIMTTVSTWDVHFAMPAPGPNGYDLMLASSTEEARTYYEGTRREWSIITSHHLRTIDASWYSLHDSVGEIRMLADGRIRTGRTAVLFPVWPDGIIGEIAWGQPGWSQVDKMSVTDRELANMRIHDAFLDAWKSGDVEATAALIEPVSCSVTRVASLDGGKGFRAVARTQDELRAELRSPEAGKIVDLELTNLALSHWYAFAAYRMEVELPGSRVERELAAFYPVSENGRFSGQLAYGFEVNL
jgi:hypothetical protein